jgi:hypothetical protein
MSNSSQAFLMNFIQVDNWTYTISFSLLCKQNGMHHENEYESIGSFPVSLPSHEYFLKLRDNTNSNKPDINVSSVCVQHSPIPRIDSSAATICYFSPIRTPICPIVAEDFHVKLSVCIIGLFWICRLLINTIFFFLIGSCSLSWYKQSQDSESIFSERRRP